MIQADIICDSVGPNRYRLTTFVLTYPRFIHAEFMTHRVFSRNASSSRAIPTKKLIEKVWNEPAMPISWGQNKAGMSAESELPQYKASLAERLWLWLGYTACWVAWAMMKLKVHKQVVNRILEPWSHITVIATATDLDNFFALRLAKGAQPEFQVLAYKMLLAYLASTPKELQPGEWHIPFGDEYVDGLSLEEQIKVGAARCARVSYLNFFGKIDHEKDYKLHDGLADDGHMSPMEHVAQCLDLGEAPKRKSNLTGWHQYRKQFSQENLIDVNLSLLLQKGIPYVKHPVATVAAPI